MKIHPEVTSEESSKTCLIRDIFGNLKYKVTLEGIDNLDSPSGMIYEIKVINCFSAPNHLIVVAKKPREKDPQITSYKQALGIYEDYVRSYKNLVKAETRDFQDIDVFSEKIGYNDTKPKCCATCHWARRNRNFEDDFVLGVTRKLECWNPKSCSDYDFDPIHHPFVYDPKESHFLGEKSPLKENPLEKKLLVLHPQVDPFGLCKFYYEKQEHYEPLPGESLGEIVDRRVDQKIEPIVSSIVPGIISSSISTVVSSTLSTVIGPAIEYQLSNHFPNLEGNRNINDYNNDGVISPDEDKQYQIGGGGANDY